MQRPTSPADGRCGQRSVPQPPTPSTRTPERFLFAILRVLLVPLAVAALPTHGWDPTEAVAERWGWRVDSTNTSTVGTVPNGDTISLDFNFPARDPHPQQDFSVVPDDRVKLNPPIKDRISIDFSPDVGKKLREAYSLATRHLRTHEQCQALFTSLGADGLEILSRTVYIPPPRDQDVRICGWSNLGFTSIGHRITRICDRFARVSDEKSAIILIHEALHHAGLPEDPTGRNGMSSREINSLVKQRCGFRPFM